MSTTQPLRRRPPLTDTHITLAHGAGGKSSAALTESVFLPAFGNPALDVMGDSAVLEVTSAAATAGEHGEAGVDTRVRLAFSTDSYVVSPIRFPGGSIGHLAVHGTVNDLAVSGAVPRWLSAAFVLEEGVPVQTLREVVADMRAAALEAGVQIVAGDTKVVPRGAADLLYVTTAGIGVIPPGRHLGAELVRPGDVMVLSGTMGRHGMAVMLARDELAIEADITSDTAPLAGLVEALLAAVPHTRWMRDATRGGVGTVANELALASGLGVVLEEERLPVLPVVRGACDLLGIDPLYVANEGLLVAVVPADAADQAVQALRAHPQGRDAVLIGEVVDEPAGLVAMRTAFGGTRLVDLLVGDPLPRIC